MANDYYSEFFIDKSELEAKFKEFGQRFNIPVEKKLKSIKNKDEFLAEIIEYHFGALFGTLFEKIEHERKIFPDSPFTPDWTITYGSQPIVAEVFRLNPSKYDSDEMKLSDTLMDALSTIKSDYLFQLKYEYNDVKDLVLDHDKFVNHIKDWITTNPIENSFTSFNGSIKIIVKQKNIGLTKVNAMSPFRPINFDYRRLVGENSRLFSKLKYADKVNQHSFPYIICMHLSFESWFKPDDIFKKLYGPSGMFYNDRPFKEYYPGAEFHTFTDGLYYSNEIIKNCVSGVMIYYQGSFTFFPNFCSTNKLKGDIMRMFDNYLYKKLKD